MRGVAKLAEVLRPLQPVWASCLTVVVWQADRGAESSPGVMTRGDLDAQMLRSPAALLLHVSVSLDA
jgi:hypothetical protein